MVSARIKNPQHQHSDLEKVTDCSFFCTATTSSTILNFSSNCILDHIAPNDSPFAPSIKIYSQPAAFAVSPSHAMTSGTGMSRTFRTFGDSNQSSVTCALQKFRSILTKSIVATSDARTFEIGPTTGVGILAITASPLSIESRKTLLNPPSASFTIPIHDRAPQAFAASDFRPAMLNCLYRSCNLDSSFHSQRPLV